VLPGIETSGTSIDASRAWARRHRIPGARLKPLQAAAEKATNSPGLTIETRFVPRSAIRSSEADRAFKDSSFFYI